MFDININLANLPKEIEDKLKAYSIIDEMLARHYEFWCGRHGIHSENPEMFAGMFFKEPSDWRDDIRSSDMSYFECINSYENAGHGTMLLETIEKAREITLRKGL